MGKLTITLDTETEKNEIKRLLVSDELYSIVFEITHNLKKKCIQRFENDEKEFSAIDGIEHVFSEIHDIIEHNQIDITEL